MPQPSPSREDARMERVAVVGSGVSGLMAAYLLSKRHHVILFEQDDRLGGHAHTDDIPGPNGPLAVDTGFIVHNDRTYPLVRRLFAELGVGWRGTEMSMSIRDERSGIEYAGGRGPSGFLAKPAQLVRRDYVATLLAARRFHRVARGFLDSTTDEDSTTFGELLRREGFSPAFIRLYAVPLVACVWSTGGAQALDYPARYLLRFLDHHGMLSIGDSPRWATVEGGSRTYVEAVASRVAEIRCGATVVAVARGADEVSIRDAAGGETVVDRVVVATHPDQALGLLTDPTRPEAEVLGAFRYTPNTAVLHQDSSLMPRSKGARASWNYLVRGDGDGAPVVTYWMNRLQGLPAEQPLYVTLNDDGLVREDLVLRRMTYAHPAYDLASVRAQRRLPELNTGRTAFAGAYHGWGFHEDGARAGVAAAASFGVTW